MEEEEEMGGETVEETIEEEEELEVDPGTEEEEEEADLGVEEGGEDLPAIDPCPGIEVTATTGADPGPDHKQREDSWCHVLVDFSSIFDTSIKSNVFSSTKVNQFSSYFLNICEGEIQN